MLRLAYNTNGFAHHRLDDALGVLADLGYQGVGLTLDVHHLDPLAAGAADVDRLARRLAALGLACTVETGARFLLDPTRKHHPSLADDERARRVGYLERAIGVAADLGAEAVAFFSGARAAGVADAEQLVRVVDAVRGLLDRARERSVTLAFEPEPGMLVGDLAGYERLRAAVGRPTAAGAPPLRLALDVGHVACTETCSIPDAIARYAADLAAVHMEDIRGRVHEHLALGEGDLDFQPILAALATSGYRGLVQVELSRSSHRAPDAAREAIAFLRAREPRAG
jgi:sugar phosphate isomerase/epimerase